jgi:hypothetical protein
MCAVPLMIGRTPMAAVRCSLLVLAAGMPSSAARAVLAQEQRTLAEANYTNLILAQNMQFDIFIVVHKGGLWGFYMRVEPRKEQRARQHQTSSEPVESAHVSPQGRSYVSFGRLSGQGTERTEPR